MSLRTIIFTAIAAQALTGTVHAAQLRMSWWGGDSRHEATQKALKVCGAKHGHSIKPEFTRWSGHFEKIVTQLESGTEADIMQINWPWLPVLSADGEGFADLKDYADIIDLSNWSAGQITAGSRKGHLNGLPVSTTGRHFVFNKTTWDKAGLPLPSTLDDLIAAGPVFAEKLGEDFYPFEAIDIDSALIVTLFGTQATGKPLIDPKNADILWSEAELEAAIERYQSLVDDHVIPSWKDYVAAGNLNLFENVDWMQGRIAGSYQWDSTYFKFSDPMAAGQELVPVGILSQERSVSQGVYRKASMVFSISAGSEQPDAAAQILNCLLNEPEGVAALGSTRGVPASKVAVAQLLKAGLILPVQIEAQRLILEAEGPAIHPYMEHPYIRETMTDTLKLFAYGRIDARTAAQRILAGVSETLDEL